MQTIKHTRSQRRTRGVTLVECLCAVSVLATSVGLALPNLHSWRERQSLMSAAAELETDIQYARSAAVAQNDAVHLTVHTTAAGT